MRQNIDGVIGEIDSLPGCTQIVVSHSVYLDKPLRGKSIAFGANIKRKRIAFDDLGYDMMICTVDYDNKSQRKILENTGWKPLTFFVSRKTGHTVELWACKPKEKEFDVR